MWWALAREVDETQAAPNLSVLCDNAARALHVMVRLPLRIAGLLLLCVSAGAAAAAAEGAQATRSPGLCWAKARKFTAMITATPLPGP